MALDDLKRNVLERRLEALGQDYSAANEQLQSTLSDVEKLRLGRSISRIEEEMRQLEQELTIPSRSATAHARDEAVRHTRQTDPRSAGLAERDLTGSASETFRVRGSTALAVWTAFLAFWILMNPRLLDADFPMLAITFAGIALVIMGVFSRPWEFNQVKVTPLARPTRFLLLAVAVAMLIWWAVGFRLKFMGEHTARFDLLAVLHAQQATSTSVDVAERTSVAPDGLGLVFCVGPISVVSGADFVVISTADLQEPEKAVVNNCSSVSNVVKGVRPAQVMFMGAFSRRGVARHSFKHAGASFEITLEPQIYLWPPDKVRVSITRTPPPPPPPPPPSTSYCKYIVFERISADDDNSKNRKSFVFRLTDGTPQHDYRTDLADWHLPNPTILVIKDLPRKTLGATISFTYRGTSPRATLTSSIDLSTDASSFRAAMDYDRGLGFFALSNEEYLRFLGSQSLDPPNCDAAPKGLSWK